MTFQLATVQKDHSFDDIMNKMILELGFEFDLLILKYVLFDDLTIQFQIYRDQFRVVLTNLKTSFLAIFRKYKLPIGFETYSNEPRYMIVLQVFNL